MKKMNLDDIQDLIKFVAKSGATEVDLEFEGIKISIKSPAKKTRREREIEQMQAAINQPITQSNVSLPENKNTHDKEPVKDVETTTTTTITTEENKSDENKYVTIKSSMIGTFYRSSSPENPPFINVGDTIKTGDTVCIIEAMKLFNEIESEISGTIIKVLVDDATPIEFDQDLFLVDPS